LSSSSFTTCEKEGYSNENSGRYLTTKPASNRL
jgi:hypothetical protein